MFLSAANKYDWPIRECFSSVVTQIGYCLQLHNIYIKKKVLIKTDNYHQQDNEIDCIILLKSTSANFK